MQGITRAISDRSLTPSDAIMIGDRRIDFDKGVESGLGAENIILVEYGWGYNRKDIPNYKLELDVNRPEDILKAVDVIENRV